MMARQDIGSQEIVSAGYDRDSKILEIEFHGSRIYQYKNVPEDVYDRLMSAGERADGFFAENIQYSYDYFRME